MQCYAIFNVLCCCCCCAAAYNNVVLSGVCLVSATSNTADCTHMLEYAQHFSNALHICISSDICDECASGAGAVCVANTNAGCSSFQFFYHNIYD